MTSAADIFTALKNSFNPALNPLNPFAPVHTLVTAPQGYYEPDLLYKMRTANIPIGIQGPNAPIPDSRAMIGSALSMPATRGDAGPPVATPRASDVFAKSYNDPSYATAEAAASKITGVPADLLARVRTLGEKSNADQVNQRTGASTPYQITAQTRAGIMKNYGLDPWSSPANAALGAAYVLHEQAGRPGPKDWNSQLEARAVGGYFGGARGAANPFGTISDGNNTVGQYTERVLGPGTKLPFAALNPYDPTYDKMAAGELNKEQAALMQPSHFNVAGPGPAPDLPTPQALPTTDFSASDKALAEMSPVAMTEKEKLTRERRGFFQGMAQAMMNMPANEGLGTFFMRLGGGALAGRGQAEDQIQKEADRFDEKMAQYKAAIYQNDIAKAQTFHSEAVAQANQNNQFARDQWALADERWKGAGGTVNISGTDAVIQRKDQNGNISVDVLPIGSAVAAGMAQQRAQLFEHMGGMQFSGNQQVASMANALAARQAVQTMSGGPSKEADAAAAAAPAMYATYLTTHGGVADVIGADGLKSLEQNVQKQLLGQQLVPGSKEYIDRHDTIVATELTKLAIASPDIMKKMMQAGQAMPSFMAADALNAARTRTATDAKGQQTSSTTMPSAASMFGPNPDLQAQVAPYGYTDQ